MENKGKKWRVGAERLVVGVECGGQEEMLIRAGAVSVSEPRGEDTRPSPLTSSLHTNIAHQT